MKTKKIEKKLVLSKETVADLNGNEMKAVYGGITLATRCASDCPLCFATKLSQCCL